MSGVDQVQRIVERIRDSGYKRDGGYRLSNRERDEIIDVAASLYVRDLALIVVLALIVGVLLGVMVSP